MEKMEPLFVWNKIPFRQDVRASLENIFRTTEPLNDCSRHVKTPIESGIYYLHSLTMLIAPTFISAKLITALNEHEMFKQQMPLK